MQMLGRLVGAVDVEIEIADVGELRDLDPGGFQPLRRSLRARYDGCELGDIGQQPVDQKVDRRAGPDSERDTVLDIGECCGGRELLVLLLTHGCLYEKRPPEKRVPATWRALHLCEPTIRLTSRSSC